MIIYNELYTILADAIYGNGAILDTYQSFVLTQIATYLSYGLLLLPVVALLVITIRLLRW